MHNARYDMLAGVLLHQIKATLPIQFADHFFPHGQGTVAKMEDLLSGFLHIQHICLPQRAQIAGLTAAFGIKNGGVQLHLIATLDGLAG